MNIEGFLMEDQKQDTLIYAGNLQVRITDWFFLKNKAALKYIGLENAVVKLNRTDSIWNFQFLADYFAPDTAANKKTSGGIEMDLKKLSLKNVVFTKKDAWNGQDMIASVGDLEMDANEININTKNIDINSLTLVQPFFSQVDYTGKNKSIRKKDTTLLQGKEITDTLLKWNSDNWNMNISSLKIENGFFKNVKQDAKPTKAPFNGQDVAFSSINGQFEHLNLNKDTFSAKINVSTKEKSGLDVQSLNSNIKITPQGMFFNELDLRTANNTTITNYFAMTYSDMDDFSEFLEKVKLQGDFKNTEISSDDLSLFDPLFKTWPKKIFINGAIKGNVGDFSGKGLTVSAGNTIITGDLTMAGLPDINQTFIDFKSSDSRTNYSDLIKFIPAVRKISQPDIARLGNIHFVGSFTGFIRDFVTFGTIHTNLGTVTSDLNMKLPAGKEPIYSGNIATNNFKLGQFIHNPDIGTVSFSGVVKGHGVDLNTIGVDVKANINEFEYKGYRYKNIVTNGNLSKHIFDGFASVNDSNLRVTLNGLIEINGDQSKFKLVADVKQANLQPLRFTPDHTEFNGLFNLNFTGNNIDNFLGDAKITNANLVRNNQRLAFDSLTLNSDYKDGIKTLSFRSNEFDGGIKGDFHITDLPNAIQIFLNKYYPSYISAATHVISHQNFTFNLTTKEVDPLIQLFDKNLKGFNDSKISGALDLANNNLQLTASVPRFQYGQYVFTNVDVRGKGDLNKLSLTGNISNVTINDTINLPNTSFSVVAQHDSSNIKISTSANQAVTKANLNADVITYTDGVKIKFDTSSFVLNTKTWTIDRGGELSFRNNTKTSGEVVLRESTQEIKLKSVPSAQGNWNDLLIDLVNVNIGDISPYLVPKTRLEGLISGSGKIVNPTSKEMTATGDFKTQYFRYNGDSLGELNINRIVYDNKNDGNLKLVVTNPDPVHSINANVNIYLKGNHTDNLIALETKEYQLKILESFLGTLFSDIQGYATGKLDIKGDLNSLQYVGKAHLHDAGLKVKFTEVFYKIKDADINLREDEIDFGTLKLLDTVTNHTATFSGNIQHESWKNMFFDLSAKVDGMPITLLNTTAADNSGFYGHAVGTGSMILVGPQSDMALVVDAHASEEDSSYITIPPSKARSSGFADFLIERTHGHAMSDSLVVAPESKMTYDIDLTADPHTTIQVILDEVTGDEIHGRGRGSLNIHSGTTEPLTINGSYFIDEGSYLFTFQSFFKRPFELRKGGSNYIKWNGDPNKAQIHFDAQYTAEKVSFAPLVSAWEPESKLQSIRDNVYVIVEMSGELFKPVFNFKLEFPPSSIANSDMTLAFNLTQIENNPNEINKQVTYLIVFNSFAPIESQGGATAASSSSPGITSALNELAYNTISGLLFNELNKQFSDILAKIFKDPKLRVSVSGSVYNRNQLRQSSSSNFNINTGDVNIAISRALFKDRLILSAGSTLDIPIQTTIDQKFQFLPDVSAEWLINPTGSIRLTFFYRQNLDFSDATSTAAPSKNTKKGGSLSYRKEFDHLGELFHRKKEKNKRDNNIITPATTTTGRQSEEPGLANEE